MNHIFQTLLVTYLVLLLAEQIWPLSVSLYLNLNYLLVIVIAAGVLDVFSEHEERKKEKIKRLDYVFVVVLGVLGFFIIKFKTVELGWLSWMISVIAGILIVLLSLLVLGEDEEEKEKHVESIKVRYRSKGFYWFLGISITFLALFVISESLTFFTSLTAIESLRIVYGSVYVLFLPGFILSFCFFPKTREFANSREETSEKPLGVLDKGSINWIERIALSFALSIAIVPLVVFYLNLIGVKINLLNSFLTILGVIVVSVVVLMFRIKRMKKMKEA